MKAMLHSHPDEVILEYAACPNGCTLDDAFVMRAHDRLHGLPGKFTVVRCLHCSLERTNPRPTPETIGKYYPMHYAPYHSPITTKITRSKIKSWLWQFFDLETRQLPLVPPGRMLEVGCASGSYMEQMRRIGWQVEGIEFAESAASVAKAKGFNVQASNLEEAISPSEPYNVITAWMVLEHLHEPVKALARMREWIKPNGYLVALVPDSSSLAKTIFKERCYDWQLPTHLFHYTPKTLERVLSNAGWNLERLIWQKNCNTMLWSAEYWAKEMRHPNILKLAQWVRTSNRAGIIRLLLGWLLGVTHQSGRIEIWARPMNDKDGE